MTRHLLALLGIGIALAACGEGDRAGIHGPWAHERTQVGDTVVVRTVGGSVWGDTMAMVAELAIGELDGPEAYLFGNIRGLDVDPEGRIYVADAQAAQIRVFSSEGRHLRDIGRRGEGPGEFSQPDALRLRSDGSLLVRDQRNARFSVFTAEGEYLGGWSLPGTFSTSAPFFLSEGDEVWNPTLRNPGVGLSDWVPAVVRYDADGQVRDTLDVPSRGFSPPRLEASATTEGGTSVSATSLPFAPAEHWAVTPEGAILFGLSREYRLERSHPDGSVLRIERVASEVPVAPGEARQRREQVIRSLRQTDPSWRWPGPEIPAVKPWFRAIHGGRDGTTWVVRHTRSEERDNPDYDRDRPENGAPTLWVESLVMDVFDAGGEYLGPVRAPERLQTWVSPVLARDRVWAVVTHELGYEQVVRFRLEPLPGP